MVGLQTLDLAIGVRVPASQPMNFSYQVASLCIRKVEQLCLKGI